MEKLNVLLREFQFDDWKDIHEYASLERACTYQPWGPNNEEETKSYVQKIIDAAQEKPRTRFAFAVTMQGRSKVIGAGEISIRDTRNSSGEISYIVNPKYWGNGYATEAARLLTEIGFTKLNLHRIYATCDPRNIASSKVLEKVGMKYEGRMRDALLIRDGWRDSMLYSILENEWKQLEQL